MLALTAIFRRTLALSVHDVGYSRTSSCALISISTFSYYHLVDSSAGEQLVPDGIIRLVVGASSLTWFISYIFFIEIYNS
jgi:hypothetical protein